MNGLYVMDRYRKEVIQVSTKKNEKKVQYFYDTTLTPLNIRKCQNNQITQVMIFIFLLSKLKKNLQIFVDSLDAHV